MTVLAKPMHDVSQTAELEQSFDAAGRRAGLEYEYRTAAAPSWQLVLDAAGYVPVAYTPAMLDYQLAYQQGHGGTWLDRSLVILSGGRPVAVWPVALSDKEGGRSISHFGGGLLPPLFASNVPPNSMKALAQKCREVARDLSQAFGKGMWRGTEIFRSDFGLSEWYLLALADGARPNLTHDLFLDLRLSTEEIRSRIRKSYRPLISSGEKLWRISVVRESVSDQVWQDFQGLHARAAGRRTRSSGSWQSQLAAIRGGSAFFVHLNDDAGSMVGGGLFHVSRDEAQYAVGAYDRDLFDKPLGHVVQYHAIVTMREMRLKWYYIGARGYRGDTGEWTEKELSISQFKQGFSSHQMPRIEFENAVEAPQGKEAD